MGKPKAPHKKFALLPIAREPFTPPKDKREGTDVKNRGNHPGANFTPDELAFVKAIDRFRHKTGRKFLSAVDHLRVALLLGYRLPEQPTTTPLRTDND